MHFRCVLTLSAEYVDDLSTGIHLIIAPLGDTRYYFVARFAPIETVAGDDDIGGEEFGVGDYGGIILFHIESADKHLILDFEDLKHLGFGILAGACSRHLDTDPVAVEGMHRIPLGHHYLFGVDQNGILAVGPAYENTLAFGGQHLLRTVFAETDLYDPACGHKVVEKIEQVVAVALRREINSVGYLLIIERLALAPAEEI